jgi:hypothetical protein
MEKNFFFCDCGLYLDETQKIEVKSKYNFLKKWEKSNIYIIWSVKIKI